MRDERAVGALDEGVVCCLGATFGGGGIDFEVDAGKKGSPLASGESTEKEGAVAVFDESSEKEGTAIEGAAGVACGVFWSSLSSSSTLTSGSFLTIVFSSFFAFFSRILSFSS
jgi:hypothetical protein